MPSYTLPIPQWGATENHASQRQSESPHGAPVFPPQFFLFLWLLTSAHLHPSLYQVSDPSHKPIYPHQSQLRTAVYPEPMGHSLAWSLQPFPSRSFGPSLLHVPVLVWLSPDASTKESGTHISPFLIYRVSVLVWGFSFALLNSSSETGFLVVQAGFILHVWLRITFLHPYPKCWAYSLCAWIVLCPGNQTQGFHILDNLSTGHPNSLSCPTI